MRCKINMSRSKDSTKYILYAVYHDLTIEERSREVYQALAKLPDVKIILNSLGSLPDEEKIESTNIYSPVKRKYLGILRLLSFWNLTKKLLKRYKPAVVVVHDDAVLIRYIKKYYPETQIVYDQSELEINRKVTGLKTAFLKCCDWFGKDAVKYCDLFISANEERAIISKEYYRFKCKYIVFNNMHKIKEEEVGFEFADKYKHAFLSDKLTIVYGGGIAEDRGTFALVDAVKSNKKLYLLVAGAEWNNLQKFNDKLEQDAIENVEYVGYVSRREWGYILKNAAASVVFYDPSVSLNFKFCASGKGYESLFMGVPIICSENPPLISLCEKYKCGICNSNMVIALNRLLENYDYYKLNAIKFDSLVNYDNRIEVFASSIKDELFSNEIMKEGGEY